MDYTTTFEQYFHQNRVMELREAIAARRNLSKTIRAQLEKTILHLENLAHDAASRLSQSPSLVERRTELEREAVACEKEILTEEHRCWQDILKLETELRDAIRQMHVMGGETVAVRDPRNSLN